MLSILAYFGCLLAIAPAITLALYFWCVSQVASSKGWGEIGALLLRLVELVGSPLKLIAIVLVLLAVVFAGCFRSTRPAGCLVLGLLGLVSLVQVLWLDRSANAFLVMTPSALGVSVSLWWAWKMMTTEVA